MLRFRLNQDNRNHGQLLRSWLDGCDDGFIAVAFLKMAGLRQVLPELQRFLERGSSLRMVVGTDFYLTEPEALRFLLGLQSKFPKFDWRMVECSAISTFHPKYYRFSSGGQIWLLTGSANLTSGGMTTNIELSAIAEDSVDGSLSKQAADVETVFWTNSRSNLPTETMVGAYAVAFEINNRRTTQAMEMATKELEALPKLDGPKLRDELDMYRSNTDQQRDLAVRRENYKEARAVIIDGLANSGDVIDADFRRAYEALVGSSGGKKLWHSGSVFRGKAAVMAQKNDVVAMIREVMADLTREPEAMYEIGLRWSAKITGLGPNIVTEFLHTLRSERYAVLNRNPVTGIKTLGLDHFPHPEAFKPADYARFCRCLGALAKHCGFSDLGEADHFLNFVYWRHKSSLPKASTENSDADNSSVDAPK